MARIRSLKPEFFTSEQVTSVSVEARYLFQGIWVFGDDEGLVKNSPRSLKMQVFPGDSTDVEPLVEELIEAGLVVEVSSDQGPLLWVPTFHEHQSPRKPTPTKRTNIGAPFVPKHSPGSVSGVPQEYRTSDVPDGHDSDTPPAPPPLERRGEEGKGEEGNTSSSEVAVAIPRPEVEDLLDLLDEELRKNDVRKLPSRNKQNRDAIRLMIDKDGISPEEIAQAIRWCQNDNFWWKNIMSAVKLREKFERLRADANDPTRARKSPGALSPNQERGLALAQQLREQEGSRGEITDGRTADDRSSG